MVEGIAHPTREVNRMAHWTYTRDGSKDLPRERPNALVRMLAEGRSNYGADIRSVKVTRPIDAMRRQLRQARPAKRPKAKAAKRAERLERTRDRIDRAAAERELVPLIGYLE